MLPHTRSLLCCSRAMGHVELKTIFHWMVLCFLGEGNVLEICFSETIAPFKKYLIDGFPQNVCFCVNLKSKMAVTTGHSVALASNGKINIIFFLEITNLTDPKLYYIHLNSKMSATAVKS